MPASENGLLQLRSSRDMAIQAAREAVRDTTRLTRLITILNDPGPLNFLLDRCLSTLSELFLADVVVLLDPVGTGSFSPLAAIGLPEDIIQLPFSDQEGRLTRLLMHTGVPVRIEIVGSGLEIDFQLCDLGIETLIGLPVNGNHAVRGVLILARCHPDPFSEADVGLLKTMAYRIGRTLLETQRGFQLEKIVQSSREINRHLDSSAITAEAAKTFPVIISADASAFILRDPHGEFYCAAQTGLSSSCSAAMLQLAEHMISSSLFGKGEAYSTDNIATALSQFQLNSFNLLPVRALLAIPIHYKDHIHGILFAIRFSAIAYNFGASQIAVLYAEHISTALENSSLYQAVQNELAERKRLEEEQRKWEQQRQQLQKSDSLHRMAGAIAHHFNNQLGAVMGNLEMALVDLPQDATPVKNLTAAMQASRKAAEISGMMLTYLGQKTSTYAPLDLSESIRQSLTLLQAAAPKGLILEADYPDPGPTISANENQIQQVLTNLATNAWEAGDKQGVVKIMVKTVSPTDIPASHRFPVDWQPQEKAYACLEIRDTGYGIAEEDIDKLFDPFFSTKFTGRGLGLPVVLGIVKSHNGVVTVESEIGRWTTLRVFFPVSIGEVPPQQVKTAQPLAVMGRGMALLLVEDEKMVREMAATMLTRLGFKVLTAKDGVEALEVFKNHLEEIRIVLSDLSMPRMGGWETLTALRQIRPDIPVVLASGYDESTVLAGDHPELPQVFLHKPYQMAELQDALERAIGAAELG